MTKNLSYRYYLFYIAKPREEVDMTRIKKISFFVVWMGEIIFLSLGQMVWLVNVTQQGWPATYISDIVQNNPGFLIIVFLKSMVLSNIPDYLTILIYLKMCFLASKTVQPDIEMQNQEAHGGIWVGENVVIQQEQNVDVQEPPTHSQHQDNMTSIYRCLRFNVIFCLVDFSFAIVWGQLMCQGTVATIVCYTFQNLTSYWIPMIALVINFEKFGSFWKCQQNSVEPEILD